MVESCRIVRKYGGFNYVDRFVGRGGTECGQKYLRRKYVRSVRGAVSFLHAAAALPGSELELAFNL